jgi:tRNA-splicing ligase RtcB (3'-phosphate/5'-hydroxy nucleic acid ligase)
VKLTDLKQINANEFEIPQSFRSDMNVPVRIIATRDILSAVLDDNSLDQAVNSATLPGLVGHVVVMPDMHQGYGFPIGGIVATQFPEGVISPGGIGYDINCGVRLLASEIPIGQFSSMIDHLINEVYIDCPSGVGESGNFKLNEADLDDVCRQGSRWALKRGFATEEDLRRTEDGGHLEGANPSTVSKRAKDRGRSQLGTLGSGNHFIEFDVVDQVFDSKAAEIMGISNGSVIVQIHCGSRGFGHQVCSDYVYLFQSIVQRGYNLPDRELVCAPLDSQEGKDYLSAMRCAANYAFTNRQLLAYQVRKAFEKVLAGKVKNWHLHQVYDVAHNIGKLETHIIEGKKMKVCVHRKGATRAFGPGSSEIPEEYRIIGQPVLVPGSMGTASWVLTGSDKSMELSFGSSCHGAGRLMSRQRAKKTIRGEVLRKEMESAGIHVRAGSISGFAEEAPQAYKDVDEVVDAVCGAGIARKVARLIPVAVIKG